MATAKKRMINKEFLENDRFYDLPIKTQYLYIHLILNADDDGFVGSPKKVAREISCGDRELKELLDNRFILDFKDSNVIVVKAFLLHNNVRKDMYRPTVHQEELKRLTLNKNGLYTEKNS